MDESFFDALWSWTTAAFAGLVLNGVALFKYWSAILGRRNERLRDTAAEKAGDWDRLRAEIARLDERCDHLQCEVDDCREREGEWMQRALAAEGALMGKGEAKQEAQRIVSTEREKDARTRLKDSGK